MYKQLFSGTDDYLTTMITSQSRKANYIKSIVSSTAWFDSIKSLSNYFSRAIRRLIDKNGLSKCLLYQLAHGVCIRSVLPVWGKCDVSHNKSGSLRPNV